MKKEKILKELGERVRLQREKIGFSQEKLADLLGYKSKASIFKVEQGITDLPFSKIEELASVLSTTTDYLMGWEIIDKNEFKIQVPLLGKVACGQPIESIENLEYINVENSCDFCLRADGDSMIDVGINPDDLLYMDKTDHLENGEIGAVVIGERVTLKKFYYYKEQNIIILKAANPKYEDQIYTGDKLKDVRVIGKAKFLTRKYYK